MPGRGEALQKKDTLFGTPALGQVDEALPFAGRTACEYAEQGVRLPVMVMPSTIMSGMKV